MTDEQELALCEHDKRDLARLVLRLEARLDLWVEYHKWLNEANMAPIKLAWLHGWRCPAEEVAKGNDYRKRLEIPEGETQRTKP